MQFQPSVGSRLAAAGWRASLLVGDGMGCILRVSARTTVNSLIRDELLGSPLCRESYRDLPSLLMSLPPLDFCIENRLIAATPKRTRLKSTAARSIQTAARRMRTAPEHRRACRLRIPRAAQRIQMAARRMTTATMLIQTAAQPYREMRSGRAL
jgi:hypothetical protein